MCMGIPMQVIRTEGIMAMAVAGDEEMAIDLSLVGPVQPGDWLLTFLGTAREVIGAEEARLINAALDGLRRLSAGGALGDAFADLDAREPQLPPHLQSAFDAGKPRA